MEDPSKINGDELKLKSEELIVSDTFESAIQLSEWKLAELKTQRYFDTDWSLTPKFKNALGLPVNGIEEIDEDSFYIGSNKHIYYLIFDHIDRRSILLFKHFIRDAHQNRISALAYCEQYKYLISAGFDGFVKLWDGQTATNLKFIEFANTWVKCSLYR